MLKRFIFISLILVITACSAKEPMIGVQTLKNDEGSKAVVKMHYFNSKEAALDYYHEKGLNDYVLMVHPDKEEKGLFEKIDAKEEDGTKSVEFLQENGNHAEDLAFAYLYEELGLGIECAFNGKDCN